MYSKTEALTEVRNILSEPKPRIWNDTDLNAMLDDGCGDVSVLSHSVEFTESFTLATGVTEYAITESKCIGIYSAQVLSAGSEELKGLQRIFPNMIGQIQDDTAGPTIFYYHFADKIGFWPPPSSDENSDVVKINGYKYADAYGGAGSETLKRGFRTYAIMWTVAMAYFQDGKPATAAYYLARYWDGLMFHRQSLVERPVDSKQMSQLPDGTMQ